MLSIFNIVDLVVTNANNNNNRNNINDNTQNINDNSNTESNANAGQSSANQVMMVPPGVGRRRKRTEVFYPLYFSFYHRNSNENYSLQSPPSWS